MITDADRLGEGSAKTKYRHNVAALKLLQTLSTENRAALRKEQAVLVQYVGWGGIPQAFDHRNVEWRTEYQELTHLLQKEEFEAARRSTQDAHYTSQPVVEAIYAALTRLGFKGGRILEPAIGTGHFVGLMPSSLRGQVDVTGIELDPITAQIAKHLYPSATIIHKGFQEVAIPESHFDLVISNPPFGSRSVYDPNHRDLSKFSIHNYFIAKSLNTVREGGIVALVITNYFLDAHDRAARAHIADHAHFLGAIRLPNTAFKKNALTEVTTDIVFLQRTHEHETPERSWVEVDAIPDSDSGLDIPLNPYFIHRPEMMLGSMKRVDKMYESSLPALIAHPDQDLPEALAAAIANLPSNVYVRRDITQEIETATCTAIEVPEEVKLGAYFVTKEGRIAQRLADILDKPQAQRVTTKKEKALARIKDMIHIRTALRELMRAEQTEHMDPATLAMRRARLNTVYDGFVRRHGYISAWGNKQAMGEDPDYPLLQSLEHHYDKGISKETAQKHGVAPREPGAQKAAIFSKQVMSPRREIRTVDSAKDALVVSMNETGGVDLEWMARLSGKQEDTLTRELQGLIFQNPQTQRWETADRYLTGDVKAKLRIATEAAHHDSQYQDNVEALRRVQPEDIAPIDISIQLGSTWVPASVVDAFVEHLLGDVPRNISYQTSIGKWIVKIGQGDPTTMHVTWGTEEAPANELIGAILTNRSIQVKDVVGCDASGNLIRKTNAEKTAAANQKADEIRQAFLDWVWEDPPRRECLAKHYNERFNTHVAPRYDGAHLTLPGASTAIELRPHQKDAIWRGIQEGSVLYDHVVGAGKTFVCIATAQESKRMGLIKKPMFVVPNHLLLQWKEDIYKLYPNANTLIAEKTDFAKENRQKLFGCIATGDWDAVVIGHSSFKKIGMPSETLEMLLFEQIDDTTDAIFNLGAERGNYSIIKEMEKARERMRAKLERMFAAEKKDKVVTFDELGVDALFIDEADEFKNLFIATSLSRISGLGNLQGADKAFDLFVKARYLQQQHHGRGVYFATGTPVANTIAEIYTMQRYLQYDEMKARGIHHFDAWASIFGQVTTGWELDATGVNYRLNSRFSKFQNVPELTAPYRSFADVVTKEDLQRQAAERGLRFPLPKIKGGKPANIVVDRSEQQAKFMGVQAPVLDDDGIPMRREDGSVILDWAPGSIIDRMERLPSDPHIDNPLKITNDARKAGLDFRLIDPTAPDFKGSKINVAVNEMVRIWQHWRDKRGAQLVFCDLSTPKSSNSAPVPNIQENRDTAYDEGEETALSMDEISPPSFRSIQRL
ncbi:Eco57I restriction-modification methylase domain-containing protein [Candidatus Glomeribacter gigasporarum]|uniref:Eco57I restriction-modification methylase domain-containing protein n=1 Tax=Candidatus Glomeribacter gigasporarum TaxID=132144 RepID=UPI00030B7B2A|nr:DEAD/DEAH box helicase family protein [Candidatus Glomeribacter gigasporarum]